MSPLAIALIVVASVSVLVLLAAVAIFYFKTRSGANPGGGKSAGPARGPGNPRVAEADGVAPPEAADTVPDGGGLLPSPPSGTPEWRARIIDAWPDPIDAHIDTAAALLQPDAPYLPMSEYDAAIPSKPITEEEDRRWAGIVAGYRFTAAPVVKGRES